MGASEFSYTKEQQKVIDARNHDILVSAAAGSGKTAVLVERIVQLISDETHPVDIDRLLIVTFTKAAAGEMRERISLALQKRLEMEPENEHLQRQTILLHNAQITTIDSFCLFVIRNNFNDIGLDPGFRSADEGELKLLGGDVMEEMMEEYYAKADPSFLKCLESLSSRGDDGPLAAQIGALYQFVLSCPWPEDWLREAAEDNGTWEAFACFDVRRTLEGCADLADRAHALSMEPEGPYFYGGLLEAERDQIRNMAEKEDASLGEMLAFADGITFARLPAGKKSDVFDPEKKNLAKSLRDRYKEEIGKISARYGKVSEETAMQDGENAAEMVRTIVQMTLDYKQRLDRVKRENNLIDFADMEHMALQILIDHTKEEDRPSKAAEDYRSYFKEILIDEYQDSNDVQELILKSISGDLTGQYNRFMVGDVKQSIYKFRQARPEIFMEKYDRYEENSPTCEKIVLARNFRSRVEVLESVNHVFYGIMQKELGGITYDDAAALYPGANYPEAEGNESELYLINHRKDSDKDKVTQEAEYIGGLIRKLMQEHKVAEKGTGHLRPLQYRDIAILVRSGGDWTSLGKKALEQQGIPVYTASGKGYFSADEIRTVMNLLRVLDNPLQDIPLFGVLHSPLFAYDDFAFTDQEIAVIRSARREEPGEYSLYECLSLYQGEGALAEKVKKCLLFIKKYRERVFYEPVKQLLRDLFEETGYLKYCSALPAGEKRRANLEMLLERAAAYESSNSYGLYSFIRYMDQLQTYEIDYGETGTLDENADVVRMMTIHKSKGLEFPVCIVAGLSKRFNTTDEKRMILYNQDLGIGAESVDVERRTRRNTRHRAAMIRKMHLEALGEELRVLYVAMTRAKEKLIMTALVDDGEKALGKVLRIEDTRSQKAPYLYLTGCSCLLDYLLPVWKNPILVTAKEQMEEETMDQIRGITRRETLLTMVETKKEDSAVEEMQRRFSFQYPHEQLRRLYTKTTVSELKLKHLEEEGEPIQEMFDSEREVSYIPEFARKEREISGSLRGTAYHRFMELLPFDRIPVSGGREELFSFLEQMKNRFLEEGSMDQESAGLLRMERIQTFLESDLCLRMRKAEEKGLLRKEQQFMMGIPASLLDQEFPETESVMIQGVIDMFWEEEDGLVLADYKTDRVSSKQELMDRYQLQLDYYGQALARLWNKPVKERILYSFHLGKECRYTE